MSTLFRHEGGTDPFDRGQAQDQGVTASQASLAAGRACCCLALPVVRVVLPPTPVRPHPTDLLLCGHHYRVSQQTLAAMNATVHKLPGVPGDTAALFHDAPSSQAPVR